MLGGILLSWQASHHRTLLLGMLLNLAGLSLGFRLNFLFINEPGPWVTSIAVCIILTMAPVFHSTHAFLLTRHRYLGCCCRAHRPTSICGRNTPGCCC
jgi:hypothetical protein